MDACRLIKECGLRLGAKSETVASACIYFHNFLKSGVKLEDESIVAVTCLYLAGKVEENHLKLRDVINVWHNIKAGGKEPLELTQEYRNIKDSIARFELLLLRLLQFKVTIEHPHRYVLHYLKSLSDWIQAPHSEKLLLQRVTWAILNDFYLNKNCASYSAAAVAIAVVTLALRVLKKRVPLNEEAQFKWNQVLALDIPQDTVDQIMRHLMETYRPVMQVSPRESSEVIQPGTY